MGREHIGTTDKIKVLGVTIDSGLKFAKHISTTTCKALGIYRQMSSATKATWGLNPTIISTIYTVPIIAYGASFWAPELDKKYVQKQLSTVQRGFAQKIGRAHRTVSKHATTILASIRLDLQIKEHAMLYETRRGRPLEHLIDDYCLEHRVDQLDLPHPAHRKILRYTCLKELTPATEHNIMGKQLYTDGSNIDGLVGAALTVWEDGREVYFRKIHLAKHCTVFQAESLAIEVATNTIGTSPSPAKAV